MEFVVTVSSGRDTLDLCAAHWQGAQKGELLDHYGNRLTLKSGLHKSFEGCEICHPSKRERGPYKPVSY